MLLPCSGNALTSAWYPATLRKRATAQHRAPHSDDSRPDRSLTKARQAGQATSLDRAPEVYSHEQVEHRDCVMRLCGAAAWRGYVARLCGADEW